MPAAALASVLGLLPEQVVLGSSEVPRATAGSITEKDRPLVIAVDGAYEGARSSTCPGVELLKWLRLKHKRTSRILLVGFQPAEEILAKHPEHLIMLAPGNRYERLPLAEEVIENLKDWLGRPSGLVQTGIAEAYKPYLAPAFDIVRFRHRAANIYGLKVMWDALRVRESPSPLPYPRPLSELLENDLQTQIGLSLYDPANRADAGNKVTVSIPSLNLMYVDDDADLGWSDFFRRLVKGASSKAGNVSTAKLKEAAQKSSDPGVIVSDVVAQVLKQAKTKQALLLDLSLFPSHDARAKDVSSMSGAKVLAELRKVNRSLPIMVTTASNKIWTYEEVIQLGADGFWVKPGVEDAWTRSDATENLERICRFLAGAVQDLVKVQKDVERASSWLQGQPNGKKPWWSEGKWPDGYDRTAQPTRVKEMLDNVLHQLRTHNQRFIFDERKVNKINERRSLASIAMTVGVLFEYIVGTVRSMNYDDRRYKGDWDLQSQRIHDEDLRKKIMEPRGKATHPQDRGELTKEDMVVQAKALCGFLMNREPNIGVRRN